VIYFNGKLFSKGIKKKMKNHVKQLTFCACLAALTCVTTLFLKIPSPLQGYMNLGDVFVLFAGFALNPIYGFISAALGSALADLFSGYPIYIPATFIIKGLMALLAHYLYRWLSPSLPKLGRLIASASAEILMIVGYFLFEGFVYDFRTAWVNIPINAVQAVACLAIATLAADRFLNIKKLK
jgi:uncharacterized membrane protein